MAVTTSIEQFLTTVRKSGLVEPQHLDEALRQWSPLPANEPRELARRLIQEGLLTRFQACFLLQGKWRNLFLSGKYKVLGLVGAGGMGTVFLAEHALMKRQVAIKVLPTPMVSRLNAVQRFYREARAVASLNHPNIVRAYDVDNEGHLHFIIMEYVDGLSLDQLVKKTGPLEVGRAANFISQVASGLQHAHEEGWIHRDIKPGNILVNRQGTVKILDLGLAFMYTSGDDGLTRKFEPRSILGTADYLSPEQAMDSHEIDIRSDVYSLGATFYFLLAGRPMFPTGNATQKLIWQQTSLPRPITELRPDVPRGIEVVLNQMLAKDPAQRYQTPAEVINALSLWAQTPPSFPSLTILTSNGATIPVMELPTGCDTLASKHNQTATQGLGVTAPAHSALVPSDSSTSSRDDFVWDELPAALPPAPRSRAWLAWGTLAVLVAGMLLALVAGLVLLP
jgi:serine/threonine protein kinase